jgi:phosphopantetheinyl transferase (holo-ACP synthase)
MIGNDIVDLELAKTAHRWRASRFQEKIFCEHEREVIANASDSFLALWRMWTMKESAFKAFKRTDPNSIFSPSNYRCRLISEKLGYIIYNEQQLKTTTVVGSKYIYTFVSIYPSKTQMNKFLESDTANHPYLKKQIYQNLRLEVSGMLFKNPDQILLKKSIDGVPFAYYKNQKLPILISISHHGRYGAFSIVS